MPPSPPHSAPLPTLARLIRWPLMLAGGAALLVLPGARRLPRYRRTSLDGVVTMRDAVQACRSRGLQGWALVAFAQQLVARQVAAYSTLNLWDPPGRAVAYGSGHFPGVVACPLAPAAGYVLERDPYWRDRDDCPADFRAWPFPSPGWLP